MRLALLNSTKQWLREPLLQFLLIGLALFAVQRVLSPGRVEGSDRKRIVLTDDDVKQVSVMWQAQGHPPPTPEEVQSLLESRIREEVLYREALAMGLDKDDTIVKRRMVQKMDFLAEDLSDLREPSREELKEWFTKNAGRFTLPGRVSFRHLYFSFDKHGEKTPPQPPPPPYSKLLANPRTHPKGQLWQIRSCFRTIMVTGRSTTSQRRSVRASPERCSN